MNKQSIAIAVGGVWLAALASAALLTYTLDRAVVLRPEALTSHRAKVVEMRPERPYVDPESTVLMIPTMFIIAAPPLATPGHRGIAEMQKQDEPSIRGPADGNLTDGGAR
jgi:hypothetical protein